MNAPANVYDIRTLTEMAIRAMIRSLVPDQNVYITSDTRAKVHPAVLVKVTENAEELAPGTGIFKQNVEVELQIKLTGVQGTPLTPEMGGRLVEQIRQCFYRNDTDPRPMVDLRNRLSKAIANPYTCQGVVPRGEGPTLVEGDVRNYGYKLVFEIHATPTR